MESSRPDGTSRTGPVVLGVLVLALAYLVWNSLWFTPYVVDDAFISLRYARMLVEGHGLVYNPGEAVEGFSNFLWVMVEVVVLALGLPALGSLKAIGVLCGVATAFMTFALGRRLFAGAPGQRWALFAAACVAFNTSLALWMQAGLETVFYGTLLVASVLRHEVELSRPNGERGFPWSAVLFACAWMTRPDAPAYGLYFVVRRLVERRQRPLGRADAIWAAVLLALVLPYELFGLAYFGNLIPNTHVAKVGGGDGAFAGALEDSHLWLFVTSQGLPLTLLLALGALGALVGARRMPPACWAPVVSGVVFLLYAWSDWMPRFRFVVPMLPFVFLSVAYGLARLAMTLGGSLAARASVALVALGLFAGYAEEQMFGAYFKVKERENFHIATAERDFWMFDVPDQVAAPPAWPLDAVTWRLLTTTGEDELVGIRDIGVPGWVARNPIWDVRGLVTPSMALARSGDPAEVAAMLDRLFEVEPALLLLGSTRPQAYANGAAQILDAALRDDPRTEQRYERRVVEGATEYHRRSREPFDVEARIERALEDFPAYVRSSERARRYLETGER